MGRDGATRGGRETLSLGAELGCLGKRWHVAQVVGDGSSPGRAGRVEQEDRCALWDKCPSSLVLKPSPDARSESFCHALVISL